MPQTLEQDFANPQFNAMSEAAQMKVLAQRDPKFKALQPAAQSIAFKGLRERYEKQAQQREQENTVWGGLKGYVAPIGQAIALSPPGVAITGANDVIEGRPFGATAGRQGAELLGGLSESLVNEPLRNLQRTGRAMLQGNVYEALRRAPGIVPGLGPAYEEMAEAIDKGEWWRLVGQATGLAGTIAAADLGPKALQGAHNLTVRAFKPKDPHLTLFKAIGFPRGKVGALENLETSMPEVAQSADKMGVQVEKLDDLIDTSKHNGVISESKKANLAEYKKMHPQGVKVDLSTTADAMIASIPKSLWVENPARAARLVKQYERYRGTFALEDAESFLLEKNSELQAYYGKNPAARNVRGNPDVAALVAQAEELRTTIYNELDKPGGGAAARELRRRYGTLMELERAAYERRNQSLRQAPANMSEQIGYWSGLGNIARGVVEIVGTLGAKGPIGLADIATGVLQRSAAKWIKESQTTDAMVKRAFKDYPHRPKPITMPPAPIPGAPFRPAGMLPAPARQMPGAQATGAGTGPSGVVPGGRQPYISPSTTVRGMPANRLLPPASPSPVVPPAPPDPSGIIPGGAARIYPEATAALSKQAQAASAQFVGRTTGKEIKPSAGGSYTAGFGVYRVPIERVQVDEDISGMPDKQADVRRYTALIKKGSEPPPLFGYLDEDTGIYHVEGARRYAALKASGAKTVLVANQNDFQAPGGRPINKLEPPPDIHIH